MRIYYWNIERANNLNARNEWAGDRVGIVFSTIQNWLSERRCNILILSEVTQTGEEFANRIRNYIHDTPAAHGYEVEFAPVPGQNIAMSPCSFMVIRNVQATVSSVGASVRRPLIRIRTPNLLIGACHLIAANPQQALEEMYTMCAEIRNDMPSILIGDMNFRYTWLDPAIGQEFYAVQGARWRSFYPGQERTHANGGILDYAWANGGVPGMIDRIPMPGYDFWDYIDHSPIGYEILQPAPVQLSATAGPVMSRRVSVH